MATTSSSGIMTMLAFSMPFLTPSAHTPMHSSIKMTMNTYVKTGSVMKPVKNPSAATAVGPSAT